MTTDPKLAALLRKIKAEHPEATNEEIHRLFREAVMGDPELSRAAAQGFVRDALRQRRIDAQDALR